MFSSSFARLTVARAAYLSSQTAAAGQGRKCAPSLCAIAIGGRRVKSNAASPLDENGGATNERVGFPTKENDVDVPVLLNSKQHVVGYLSKVLNARVYEASIETELQHAKNLSAVS